MLACRQNQTLSIPAPIISEQESLETTQRYAGEVVTIFSWAFWVRIFPQLPGLEEHFFFPDSRDVFRNTRVFCSGTPAADCCVFDLFVDGAGDAVVNSTKFSEF